MIYLYIMHIISCMYIYACIMRAGAVKEKEGTVCGPSLTYADVCCRMLPYADVC